MRLRRVLTLGLLAGCGFQASGVHGGDAAISVDTSEPPIDALPTTCTPGEHACDGRDRLTCGASNTWDPAQTTTCDYTCAASACVVASNIPTAVVTACSSSAPALTPPAGSTVVLTQSGGTHIECAPNCGDPNVTQIAPSATVAATPSLAVFCLSSISLPSGVKLARASTGGPAAAIAFVVDGEVSIAGEIDFDGGAGVATTTEGEGGGFGAPGGFDGAGLSSGAGVSGKGPCAGKGGKNDGSSNHWIGGGGSGGGNATSGGAGGNGKCQNGDHSGEGAGTGDVCGTQTLIPLVGGSGGGAGGDGTTGIKQGWAAGGGGGALQISARKKITLTGALRASGGAGYGNSAFDGGGGGGAGGALLLEAPTLSLAGPLRVEGGNGGMGGAGLGGHGAAGATGPAAGLNFAQNGQSGSGGGGAGGRIRLNSVGASCPATASPAASCTSGVLVPQ